MLWEWLPLAVPIARGTPDRLIHQAMDAAQPSRGLGRSGEMLPRGLDLVVVLAYRYILWKV